MNTETDDPIPFDDDDELLADAIPIDGIDVDEEDELEPIDLAEDDIDEEEKKEIRALGRVHKAKENWLRQANKTGTGATHCKTFVGKLRLDAIEHMDQTVNAWLDEHPELEVKLVTTTIGELKSKITEPAIFMTVWV